MDMESSEENRPFVARCYTKKELAGMYFPELCNASGVQKLKRWMYKCTQLHDELEQAGYGFDANVHNFTPREVRLIVRYLGEPF